MLNNLISNAIRYHNPERENPFVRINANINESGAKIEVEDNGIGISQEYHEKVFEMFYRVSESSNGSGLGLYIVKEAVNKLNGDITVKSTPGVGSKFTLHIPNIFFE